MCKQEKRLEHSGHSNVVNTLINLNDNEIASGSEDKLIKLWNVSTGKEIITLSGHSDSVCALINLNDNEIASGSGDNLIKFIQYL